MTREAPFSRSYWFQKRERPSTMPLPITSPAGDSVRSLHLSDFDLRFDRYRLIQPKADLLMARSLAKYDQLAPVIYCQLEGSLVLVDGFKRLRAARTLKGVTSLQSWLTSERRNPIGNFSANGSKRRCNESRNRLAWKLDRARSTNN